MIAILLYVMHGSSDLVHKNTSIHVGINNFRNTSMKISILNEIYYLPNRLGYHNNFLFHFYFYLLYYWLIKICLLSYYFFNYDIIFNNIYSHSNKMRFERRRPSIQIIVFNLLL